MHIYLPFFPYPLLYFLHACITEVPSGFPFFLSFILPLSQYIYFFLLLDSLLLPPFSFFHPSHFFSSFSVIPYPHFSSFPLSFLPFVFCTSFHFYLIPFSFNLTSFYYLLTCFDLPFLNPLPTHTTSLMFPSPPTPSLSSIGCFTSRNAIYIWCSSDCVCLHVELSRVGGASGHDGAHGRAVCPAPPNTLP